MQLQETIELPMVVEKLNELIGRTQLLEARIAKYDNL